MDGDAKAMGRQRKPLDEKSMQVTISMPQWLHDLIIESLERNDSRSAFICDLIKAHFESIKGKN